MAECRCVPVYVHIRVRLRLGVKTFLGLLRLLQRHHVRRQTLAFLQATKIFLSHSQSWFGFEIPTNTSVRFCGM